MQRAISFLLVLLSLSSFSGVGVDGYTWLDSFRKCSWNTAALRDGGKFFRERLCGQPYASHIIPGSIYAHSRELHPTTPLVMSWHGDTGVGKTFASDHLPHFGHVVWFHGMDRATTRQTPQQLALDIHERITSVLRLCTKVMFVFDDADLFPAAVIDALGEFVAGSGRVQAAKAVFIFILNTGMVAIENYVRKHAMELSGAENRGYGYGSAHLEQLKLEIKRELVAIPPQQQQQQLQQGGSASTSTESAARNFYNNFVEKSLLRYVVPFLPLERAEVKCCVRNALRQLRADYTGIPQRFDSREAFDQHEARERAQARAAAAAAAAAKRWYNPLTWFPPEAPQPAPRRTVAGAPALHWLAWTSTVEFKLASRPHTPYDSEGLFAFAGCRGVNDTVTDIVTIPLQGLDPDAVAGEVVVIDPDTLELRVENAPEAPSSASRSMSGASLASVKDEL